MKGPVFSTAAKALTSFTSNRGVASLCFAVSLACTIAPAHAAPPKESEPLRAWKSSVINKVHEEVRNIDFRERGNGFSFCRVSFKVHRDGSVTDLETNDRAHGEFAAQVRAKIESLAANNVFQIPQNLPESPVKIEFSLTQDDKIPITEKSHIVADPLSTGTVAATWDEWHRKIVEKLYNDIYHRIEPLLLEHKNLHCIVTYRIRKMAHIEVLKIEGSPDLTFRGTVTRAVESLQNNPIIIFPACAGSAASITKRSEFEFHAKL